MSDTPIRNCTTCAHFKQDADDCDIFNRCNLYQRYCSIALRHCALQDWEPAPQPKPRRSLRGWFYDTFWKAN